MLFIYPDEQMGFEIYTDDNCNLFYYNGCELIHFTHYSVIRPSGMFEVYMDGRFRKFDDLAMLAYAFLRSDDMEW